MPLQLKMQRFSTASPLLATFDFQDIAAGIGYVAYQGYNTENDSSKDYHMSRNSFHSDDVETESENDFVRNEWASIFDVDFDTSIFTLTRTLEGTAIINTTAGFFLNSVDNIQIRIIATLYVVNDSGATLLGQVTTKTYSASSNNSWKTSNFSVLMELANRVIKTGEWLRLNINVWGFTGSSAFAGITTILGHSPFNLSGNIDSSTQDSTYNQTIVNIPFLIET